MGGREPRQADGASGPAAQDRLGTGPGRSGQERRGQSGGGDAEGGRQTGQREAWRSRAPAAVHAGRAARRPDPGQQDPAGRPGPRLRVARAAAAGLAAHVQLGPAPRRLAGAGLGAADQRQPAAQRGRSRRAGCVRPRHHVLAAADRRCDLLAVRTGHARAHERHDVRAGRQQRPAHPVRRAVRRRHRPADGLAGCERQPHPHHLRRPPAARTHRRQCRPQPGPRVRTRRGRHAPAGRDLDAGRTGWQRAHAGVLRLRRRGRPAARAQPRG
ncbi:conserved hypothetical protein [Ricinus communis]|uniref:Uncharacterized protein n=1 Tax=Ricinus communis TaxID=3988 RepID=B9TCA0_RICCO|nr:conserved hypothetical protein [Ricinus communis]